MNQKERKAERRPRAKNADLLWPAELQRIVEQLRQGRSRPLPDRRLAENFAGPVVSYAVGSLVQSVPPHLVKLLAKPAFKSLTQSLLHRLVWTGRHAVDQTWQTFASTVRANFPALSSRDCRELVPVFFSSGVECATIQLLEDYPVLARLWTLQTLRWRLFVTRFLRHTAAFAARRRLGRSKNAPVTALRADLSDLHTGHRAVLAIEFADGTRWFYKPRSGRSEAAWFKLLTALNRIGFHLPLATPAIKVMREYCWMEAVPQRSCSGPAEAARFFQRAGALLYLVEYLRGVDFHAGNLVAAGSQPVLIDCETLLHRDTPLPPHCRNEEHSLLRTGMVPLAPLRKAQESVSALGGPLGGEHRVVLGGKAVQAAEFADALIAGYRGMDIFFDNNRKAFRAIERLVKEFRVASSRLIYRPTQQYFAIVERCLSANLLSSERKWSSFLQSACRAQSIIPKSVIDQEIACLRECEIPVFRGRPCCPARPSKKTVDRNAALLRILLSSVSQSAN